MVLAILDHGLRRHTLQDNPKAYSCVLLSCTAALMSLRRVQGNRGPAAVSPCYFRAVDLQVNTESHVKSLFDHVVACSRCRAVMHSLIIFFGTYFALGALNIASPSMK